jgi:hypothetical protein
MRERGLIRIAADRATNLLTPSIVSHPMTLKRVMMQRLRLNRAHRLPVLLMQTKVLSGSAMLQAVSVEMMRATSSRDLKHQRVVELRIFSLVW